MNFAPYQDASPETERALSPPPRNAKSPPPRVGSPRIASPRGFAPRPFSPTGAREDLPSPADFEDEEGGQAHIGRLPAQPRGGFGNQLGADERNVDVYGTSLPLRLDIEAALAYILLPPASGAVLLMFEWKSDYVRFHAWQSSLVFGFTFILHLIFSFTKVVSFLLLAVDLTLMAYLSIRAYRDANTLDRCELPFFGRLASSFVDEE